jgi:hypothetical protein
MNGVTLGEAITVVVTILAVGVPTFLIGRWAYRDAEARGKPGWLVVVLILSGGGLFAWLVLRNEVIRKSRIQSSAPIQTTSQEL